MYAKNACISCVERSAKSTENCALKRAWRDEDCTVTILACPTAVVLVGSWILILRYRPYCTGTCIIIKASIQFTMYLYIVMH